MKHLRVAIFILAIIGITAPVEAANRVALIIGNSDYKFTPALRNPRNDAKIMTEKLTGLGFDVVSGLDLTHRGMLKAVKDFEAKLKGAKVGMFFYAGHGLQIDGENYLIPTDARPQDKESVKQQSLSLSDVLRVLEFGTETNLVFLDACRDNPLTRSLSRSSSGASRSVGTGLAAVEVGKGTLITYSTQPGNVAADGVGHNSPFTNALAKWIGEPGLEVRQMLTRVRRDVLAKTYGQQVPWDHSSLTGDFYFGDPTGKTPVASRTPANLPALSAGQMAVLQRLLSREGAQQPASNNTGTPVTVAKATPGNIEKAAPERIEKVPLVAIEKGKWKVGAKITFDLCPGTIITETFELPISEERKSVTIYSNERLGSSFLTPRIYSQLSEDLKIQILISASQGSIEVEKKLKHLESGDVIKIRSTDGLQKCGIMNAQLTFIQKL